MNWLSTNSIIRVAAMSLGVLFLGLASLTYESEEQSFQSRLERWWVQLDEKRQNSRSWTILFVQIVARLTNNGLDRVFGKKLLSARVIATSIILSCASLFITSLVLSSVINNNYTQRSNQFMLLARLCIFIAIPAWADSPNFPWKPWLPRFVKLLWWLIYGFVLLVIIGLLIIVAASSTKGAEQIFFLGKGSVAVLAVSFVFDFVFIFCTRKILRRAMGLKDAREIIVLIAYQIALLAALCFLPVYLSRVFSDSFPAFSAVLVFAVALNSIDIFVTLIAILVALLFLFHRAIWPLIQRPIYAIQRFQIVKQKTWLWSAGLTLIILAVTGVPDWLKHFLGKVF